MKKILSVFLCICLICSLPIFALAEEVSSIPAFDIHEVYSDKQMLNSWWDVLAFAAYGIDPLEEGYPVNDPRDVELFGNASALAAEAISLMARGMSPRHSIQGIEIIRCLISMQKEDGSFGDYINQHIYSIIALEAAGAYYRRDDAVEFLLNAQLADGGFAYFGEAGDVDVTGMALCALGLFKEDAAVTETIDRAVEFLSEARTDSFGYISPWSESGLESPESAAAVLSGLVAAGIDLTENDWDKTIGSLMACKTDGGFASEPGGDIPNEISTQQALVALGDIAAGQSVFTRLKYVPTVAEPFEDGNSVSAEYAPYVLRGYELGIFKGDTYGNFNPSHGITRAEFAVILLRAWKGIPEGDFLPSDMTGGEWYEKEVSAVISAGIMDCRANGAFDAISTISLDEAYEALTRLFELMTNIDDPQSVLAEAGIAIPDEDAGNRALKREESAAVIIRAIEAK